MNIDIKSIISGVGNFVLSEDGQKFICGTYSDGSPRSLVDAARDEFISPESREKWDEKKKKKKKKSKKKNKKSSFDSYWNF